MDVGEVTSVSTKPTPSHMNPSFNFMTWSEELCLSVGPRRLFIGADLGR
jgi:hypothetical protein